MIKNSSLFYIIIFLSVALVGCEKEKNTLYPYGWTPTGMPSDSLLIEMDRTIMTYGDPEILDSLVNRYCDLSAKEDKDNKYEHRRIYWRGNASFLKGEYEKGDSLRRMALEICDSTVFPRDYRLYRMTIEQPTDFTGNISRYDRYKSDLDVFMKSGDRISAFNRAVMLMGLMSEAGMNKEALHYAILSDSLLSGTGLPLLQANNRVNLASAYFSCGDTVRAVEELRSLRKSPESTAIPSISAIIDYNLFEMTKDTTALQRVWKTVNENEELAKMSALVAAAIINSGNAIKADPGQLSEALALASDYDYLSAEELEIAKAGCNNAIESGDAGAMCRQIEEYEKAVDRYINRQHQGEVIAAETSSAIRKVEEKERINKEKLKTAIWIIISITLLALFFISIILLRFYNRQKRNTILKQLEEERLKREIIAKDLMLVEKQKLNDRLQIKIDEMVKAKEVEQKTAETITKLIESTDVKTRLDLEDAEFLKVFMERFPNVSKTGRRLALYIRKGLDTAQIATEMNIRKESVMQGRWRLRSRMGLEADSDLDVELRKM